MERYTQEPIGKYIAQVYRRGIIFITKNLADEALSWGQIMPLIHLYQQDGIRQEELSERLSVDKATTARALKKLETGGFITKKRDALDKRAYNIYLTQKALDKKTRIYEVLDQWENHLLQTITPEEKDGLVTSLKKLCLHKDTLQEDSHE